MTSSQDKRVWEKDHPSHEEINAAMAWAGEHKNFVENLIQQSERMYQPTSREDCRTPALWSPAHWKWLTVYGHIWYPGKKCAVIINGRKIEGVVSGYSHRYGGIPIVTDIHETVHVFKTQNEFVHSVCY